MMALGLLGYIVALCLGLATFVYLYVSRKQQYWQKKGVACLEPSIIFGHFKNSTLRKLNFGEEIREIYQKTTREPYVGMYFFHRPILLIRDTDIIKNIMSRDFHHFENHNIIITEDADPLQAKHLFSLRGQRWKNMRIKLTPTFTSGKMKKMFHLVCECAEDLVEFLDKPSEREDSLEWKDVIAKFTTDVIATCAFGIQVNSLKNPDAVFRKMGKKISEPPGVIQGLKLFISLALPAIGKFFKVTLSTPDVTDFFRNIVRETMGYRESKGLVRNDFLDLLIQLKNKGKVDDDEEKEPNGEIPANVTKQELSEDDLVAQVFVFFVAGFETSSSLISFALYELAINPHVQTRLREEVDEFMKKNNGKLDYQTVIHDMTYLDKVVQEALRKYPPLPALDRVCTKPYTIPNTDITLDEGVLINISALGMHYDPKFFPNPEKFDPERFSEEEKVKRPHYCYLPFGEGPRQCVGLRFGLMQSKVGLVSLLSKYEFHLCDKTVIPFVQDPAAFLTTGKYGTWLKITKRN